MNILLLAAGKGQRFLDVGYEKNKPLIEVNGVPMWKLVLDNVLTQLPDNLTYKAYIATKEEYGIVSDEHTVINLVGDQKGAAYSAVQAIIASGMDQNKPLMILNVDQLVFFSPSHFGMYMEGMEKGFYDGFLLHFIEPNGENKWGRSVMVDPWQSAFIKEIVEKTPVSHYAHTGHYIYKKTYDFVHYATIMMKDDYKINGEYFISPAYNYMLADNKKLTVALVNRFVGLGLPEDLKKFLSEGA